MIARQQEDDKATVRIWPNLMIAPWHRRSACETIVGEREGGRVKRHPFLIPADFFFDRSSHFAALPE
jgi:hypothetical protein